ncbi:hypothetical protein SAMD00079811_29690 [Scytonema sp. HK-05]|nr:hypothetical protein SAMD00079811_29690 [Scytonema sp. HK-05]
MPRKQGLPPLNFGDTPLNDQQYASKRGSAKPEKLTQWNLNKCINFKQKTV